MAVKTTTKDTFHQSTIFSLLSCIGLLCTSFFFWGGGKVYESLAIFTTTEAWRVEQARPRAGNFRPAANCNLPLYARWLRTDCYMEGRTRHPSRHLGLQEGSGRCDQVGRREGGRRENNSEPTWASFDPTVLAPATAGL